MKNLLKLTLIGLLFITSCNKDEGINTSNEESEEISEITVTETCLLSDFEIQENSTITIDCLLDLEGQTVTIPADVTFDFDGGDIFNGTLNFESNGKIDGKLLNSDLSVEGDIELISNEFLLQAERWNILEGEVTSQVAENNKVTLNELLIFIDSLVPEDSVDFTINNLDAYFKTDGFDHNNNASIREGIIIPSNFNLILSDTVYLRMYPNDNKSPALIFIGDGVENITITGGNFIGERDEHDYSQGAQEWGHLLRVGGANNIRISEAEFVDAMGDGIDVHGFGHSFDPYHIASTEIYITNNTFRRNRRNQISVTAGNHIYRR